MRMSASESIKVVSIRYTYYAATSKNLFTILEMSAGVYLMYLPVFLAKSTLTYLQAKVKITQISFAEKKNLQ